MRIFNRVFNKVLRMLNYSLNKLPKDKSRGKDLERLAQYAIENDQIKLHFGCGPRILKGWINIDLTFERFKPYLQYYTD